MLSKLKDHPFAVQTHFETSLVLTFAVPKEQLEDLIPDCLTLDTLDNIYGFIAIAMVQTKDLRPKGFPKILGNDFFLIGYRVFVKYVNKQGKIFRGLYILKSETNKRKMQFYGNLFTHYNYTTTDISTSECQDAKIISSNRSNFHLLYSDDKDDIKLPKKSPFNNWKEAKKFAGPLPFTFTYNEKAKEILIIQAVRKQWRPRPIEIIGYHFDFLESLKLSNVKLANAFIIKDLPYQWKKGRKEIWKH